MYSPTARLLAVLELLQSHKRMSGAEIAQRLEVNARTVRRYITTLQDMGIPIEGERGPAGFYELGRGHRLPPLLYTEDEAVALSLGLIVLRAFQFPVDVVALEGASAKTERVIPDAVFRRVQSLRHAIVFNPGMYGIQPPPMRDNQFIVTLASAAQERRRVLLSYRSWSGELTERWLDPYAVVYNDGYWYAVGYCHLRGDMRTFRIDRIQGVQASSEGFDHPDDFDALGHVLKSIAASPNQYRVEILLEAPLETVQQWFDPMEGTFEETSEGTLFRRTLSELDWLAYVLLRAPFRVRVNQPLELREMLHEIGSRALSMGS
jgi:predicted DNA-binding transcriptional regulator YafY